MSRNYLQWVIFERDSYTCILCDKAACELHHVVPVSKGGGNIPQNLVSICRVCHELLHGNRIRGVERTPQDARQVVIEYLRDCYAEAIQAGSFPW